MKPGDFCMHEVKYLVRTRRSSAGPPVLLPR